MSLILRRGTDAQRQTITFDQGEVIYTTDTQKLYVGDGATLGGKHILASSAGAGVTFNSATQTLDFSTTNLGITTSNVAEGANHYFTSQRAQDAAASLFTATGAPSKTGNITGVDSDGTVHISGTTTADMVTGETFVVSGTPSHGLSATTYYVCTILTSTTLTIASTRPNAFTGAFLTSFTTGVVTGTTFGSGAEDTAITFTYDSVNHIIRANVALDGVGITAVSADPSPTLGGDLSIGNYNITGSGTGFINIAGGITSGDISTTSILASTSIKSPLFTGMATTDSVVISSSNPYIINANCITDGSGINTPAISINAAKGTLASPTNTTSGDKLLNLQFSGYYNGTYLPAITFQGQWDTNAGLGSGYPGGKLLIGTGNGVNGYSSLTFDSKGILAVPTLMAADGSATHPSIGFTTDVSQDSGFFHPGDGIVCTSINGVEKVRVDANGMRVVGFMKVAGYATSSLPSPAEAGMIALDTTTNQFKGYNGSSWVVLG